MQLPNLIQINRAPAGCRVRARILIPADDDSIVTTGLRPDHAICRDAQAKITNVNGVTSPGPQHFRETRRKLLIDQEPHAAMTTAWSTSLAA